MTASANLSRRSLLATGAVVASAAALSTLVGCSSTKESSSATEALAETAGEDQLPPDLKLSDLESSPVELQTPTEFVTEETYDIVVIGAGIAGVPAVCTALEEGATVACLQKESIVAANGFSSSGICLEESTPGGISRYIADWAKANNWRVDRTLFRFWAEHSGETESWYIKHALDAGFEPQELSTAAAVVYDDGEIAANFDTAFVTCGGNQAVMAALAEQAQADGAVFYFSTPAVSLVQDGSGAVTGAIGKQEDGSYIKLNASKAVILAAGDYQNNDSMKRRFCGDAMVFKPDQINRTGDGHILGCLAGGSITPAAHARQIHCGTATGRQLVGPYLHLDPNGNRFMDEESRMTEWNTEMKYLFHGDYPILRRFFDSEVGTKYPGGGDASFALALIEANGTEQGLDGFLVTADTLDELMDLLQYDEQAKKNALASIEHYNEMCANGVDEDFGKDPSYMKAIDTPPYFGVYNTMNFAAINGGLEVNEYYQVIDQNREPIPGLYAAGTNAGAPCGGINWTMPSGFSNGHCMNAGRYTVIHALTGDLTPSQPVTFEELKSQFAAGPAGISWENGTAGNAIPLW